RRPSAAPAAPSGCGPASRPARLPAARPAPAATPFRHLALPPSPKLLVAFPDRSEPPPCWSIKPRYGGCPDAGTDPSASDDRRLRLRPRRVGRHRVHRARPPVGPPVLPVVADRGGVGPLRPPPPLHVWQFRPAPEPGAARGPPGLTRRRPRHRRAAAAVLRRPGVDRADAHQPPRRMRPAADPPGRAGEALRSRPRIGPPPQRPGPRGLRRVADLPH